MSTEHDLLPPVLRPRRARLSVAGSLLLWASCVAGCAAAPPATPPESSPVYAEEAAPGAEPIAVEQTSTDDPEVKRSTPAEEPEGDSGSDQKTATEESPPEEEAPAPEEASPEPAPDDAG